jgi:long-chain acyl-CoA synthetase
MGQWRPGYVGKPLPGAEFRLAEDGELLVRSPGRMLGYLDDEQSTRAAYTDDGFFKFGDFVEVDADGHVRIRGRKKEVLNAPDGTNIYAAYIEGRIASLPWVDQVVVVGDQKPYLAALIVIKDQVDSPEHDGYLVDSDHARLHDRARADLATLNEKLEPVEVVKRFALFAKQFPTDLYSVTAALGKVKLKRAEILASYAARINALYT